MGKLKIEYMNIDDIIPYINNPRKNDDAVGKVASSIKNFGFKVPIIVDKDNEIIAGHTRLKAAKKLGLEEVPVIRAEDLNEAQVKAFRIADNKTGELAEWDFELLENEIEELKLEDFDLELTGFDFDELDELFQDGEYIETEEDDFEIEEPENPISKRGDVWLLGRHRLMCGDSTCKEDVDVLMNEGKADLILTDPPYNVDYTGKTKDALKILNDSMDDESFYKFLYIAFTRMYEVAKDGASIYVLHADSEGLNFRKALTESGFKLAQCCIWAKQTMVMGRQDYHWQHEPILYGWKPTASHNWYSDRKQTTLWHFDRPFRNEYHPTMKPVSLVAYPIQNSSKKGDLVLDLFGGSGSTLIAAEQLNRICYMMELDEKYVDVIVDRYIDYKESSKEVYLIRNGKKIPFKDIKKQSKTP